MKYARASGGVSVWVSNEQVRIMAEPLVGVVGGAVRLRVGVVGPGDKKDKTPRRLRDKEQVLVRLRAMRIAAGR